MLSYETAASKEDARRAALAKASEYSGVPVSELVCTPGEPLNAAAIELEPDNSPFWASL